jgi:hypothetical protein
MKIRSFFHFHFRIARLQIARVVPVRRRAPAIKQTCFGQDEGAGAGGGHPAVSPQTLPHKFDQPRCRRFDRSAAADDQRVEIGVVERLGQDAHAD